MQLETERLLLRRPQPGDLDAYSELFSDPEVVRYTGGVTKTRDESELALQRMIRHWEDFEIGLFSVVQKRDNRMPGRVGFLLWDAESWLHARARPAARPKRRSAGRWPVRTGAAVMQPKAPERRETGRGKSSGFGDWSR